MSLPADYHWKTYFRPGEGEVAFTQGNGRGLGKVEAERLERELHRKSVPSVLHLLGGANHYLVETSAPVLRKAFSGIETPQASGGEIQLLSTLSKTSRRGV